ncbi:MAG: DUF4129 domain-containing protein, partial [Thermoplasmata archaeon]|nr:DUF4129 domain-containing protein [Thermoplasmata archaeon]
VPDDARPGPHNLNCTYDGNDSFLSYTYMDTIKVYVPTHIEIQGKRSLWSAVNISGKVKDNLEGNVQGFVEIYFEGTLIQSDLPVGENGFRMTYRYHEVEEYDVTAVFQPIGYYKSSHNSATFILFSYLIIDYSITSPITNEIPLELDLENPVLAGKNFNFTMRVTSDLGREPDTGISFRISFKGSNKWLKGTDYETEFHVPGSLIPQEEHYLMITDEKRDKYFELYPNPRKITINVIQPTHFVLNQEQANGILYLNGSVMDCYHRPVKTGMINAAREGTPIDVLFASGMIRYTSDAIHRMGPEDYTFTYATNEHYFHSSKNLSIYIKGFTVLSLHLPHSLRYGERFEGSVHFTLWNGDPVEGAVISLMMNGDEMTVITGADGERKFHGIMDTNHSIKLTASFAGTFRYYPAYDEKTIKFEKEKEPILTISDLLGTRAFVLYTILGVVGFYLWRRKQINYFMSLVHDTALRLDAGGDPKSVIIIAYNLMCRHLRRFNLFRRHYETVGEFKEAAKSNLRLSEEGIGNLTSIFEFADYGETMAEEVHKEEAVQSLRNVERELA